MKIARLLLVCLVVLTVIDKGIAQNYWPREISTVHIISTKDQTKQPALFYAAPTDVPAPLLVGLHTWGGDYAQTLDAPYGHWCVNKGWHFIHPHFRGPNSNKDSLGSEFMVQDVIDAVEYARAHAKVDDKRIYLIGGSGGGHAALLMAGRAPQIWAGVSSWVPVVDLVAFYHESAEGAKGAPYRGDFVKHLENACGGPPGATPEVDEQYRRRSPLAWLHQAKEIPLDINAGVTDGFGSGAVYITHAFKAFNAVAAPQERIPEETINITMRRIDFKNKDLPAELKDKIDDPLYGKNFPLIRRQSGKTRLTIFSGGHDILFDAALHWLEAQQKP